MSFRIVRYGEAVPLEPVSWPALATASAVPAADTRELDEAKTALAAALEDLRAARSKMTEMAAAHQEAEAAAYQRGLADGTAATRATADTEQKVLIERISRAIADIAGLRTRIRRDAEGELVKLALAIARRITHREITIDSDALLGVVRSALAKVPARELTKVRLHPSAVDTVRFQLESLKVPSAVEVEADSSLEPGDLFLETVSGTLDASIDTQLREIERGFCDYLEN